MSLRCLLERLNGCLADGLSHQDWNPASPLTGLPRRPGRRRRRIGLSRISLAAPSTEQLEARALLTTNLALFQNVVADSVHQDNAAEEAIDGIVSLESRWASADTAGPHWLEVQLQAPYPVGSAQVYLGDGWTNDVADFEIQYHDGDQWQTAVSVAGDNSKDHNLVFANTIDTATRYRIYTEADRLQVREFVLLPPNGGNAHPLGTGANLNLGSRYFTEVTSTLGTNYPGNAVDGYVSDDSRWVPNAASGTHQIEVQLQQRQGVGSLHLYTGDTNGANHLANFNVEFFHTSEEYRAIPGGNVSSGSIDGGTITGVTSGEVVINFTWPVSTDRIRVSSSDSNMIIREAVALPPSNSGGYPIGTSVQFASPPTTQFNELGDAWYQLVSRQNNQALVADETGATQSAAPVDEAHKYQLLYSYSLDAYRIRSKDSALALQVKDASQVAGAAIIEGEYSAAPHQLWKLEPTDNGHVQIVNVWSGMVLHTDGSDPGVVTQQPFDAAANPANNVEWQVDFVENYFKKGAASKNNGSFGSSWWYNWGRGDFPEAPDDQFYAPMQWGPWNQNTLHQRHDDWNDDLKPSYLLGFNEPDSANQANMTVERAIEIWPQLQALGVPLLSPAGTQNGEGRTWHTEFTDQADALGYRQDYAGMHWYGSPNVNNILNYVDTISNLAHGRDVWITEFSPVDWSGGSGNWSEETNYNFILEFVYRADRKENLDKYAMFMWTGDQPATPWEKSNPRANAIISNSGGELTPYGKAYAGWDGKSDPELETLYIIHNRAATHRLQNDGSNDGSNDVGNASIRSDDTSVQWIVQDAGNDEVFITSPLDGRRLKLDAGNIVMSDAGATGWGVRWKIEQDQYGWQNVIHSGSGNYLRMNRSNDASGAPTGISLDVVSPGTAGTGANWWFVKPYQELGLTLDSSSIAEDGTATATLSTTLVTGVDTVVTLSVDDDSVVGVPVSVTIPAGQPSVTFTVTAVDDDLVDGTQSAFITADAADFQHAIAAIEVTDNDAAELALVIAADEMGENGGSSQATISRNTDLANDLDVALSSSDISEATVPASVTIPAGASSVTFDIVAQNDAVEDGTVTVTVTATATDYATDTDTIDVLDDEGLALSLSVDASSISESGTATATVQREGDTSAELIVSLASNDTDEAMVPASVTISPGQTSATFTVSGVDDGILDVPATVTITASATNFEADSGDVEVQDVLNHRMSELTVIVQDQHGNPLPNATIDVSMTRHDFTFGTQVRHRLFGITQPEFDALSDAQKTGLLESGSGSGLVPTWTDVTNYRDAVYAHFNHIVPTNGMQWVAYNNAGPTHVDTAINLAQAEGFTVTGHAAVWGKDGWPTPNEYRSAANPNAQDFLDALIADRLSNSGVMARYSDAGDGPTITDWDVLNEPLHEHYFANTFVNAGLYANSTAFYADVFRRAHAVRPDARLAVNDYNIITSNGDAAAEQFRDFVNSVNAELAGEDASIEVIKVQAHTWLTLSRADITRRLDILAETGLPIVISEFDMRDDGGQLNASQQEQTFRAFLEASFEHPNVEAFTMWGFWDPGHWRGNGPLYNQDWSFKAEAAPWTDLVEGDWQSEFLNQHVDTNARWTNDLALFDGLYTITANDGTDSATVESVELSADRQFTITINVSDPALTLAITADSVSEGDGTAATTATVTRNTDTTSALEVTLASDNTLEATAPTTVTIPAGQASFTFNIDAVEDAFVDGNQTVVFTATATQHTAANDSVIVTDNDSAELTLAVTETSISENGGTSQATISRNTDTLMDLVVDLSSDNTDEAVVPDTVIIPAGQTAVSFSITAVDELQVDGLKTVTVAATANNHASSSRTIDVTDDDVPELTLTIDLDSITEKNGTSQVIISRNTDTSVELVVTLMSSDQGEAAVPDTVTIPVGLSSAAFAINGVDDAFVDGIQSVIVTATADGFVTANDTVEVTDDDVPELTLFIDQAEINEDGTSTATVSRNTDSTEALVVSLASSNLSEASVPATVTIAAGDTSATFQITAISDGFVDGTQIVTIDASATNHAAATNTIDVLDVDTAKLTLDIDIDSISENGGIAQATITRNTVTTDALTVSLTSSDTNKATVPTTVTIPPGQLSAVFAVTAIDDLLVDGLTSVDIAAEAEGHTTASQTISISDDDSPILNLFLEANEIGETGQAMATVSRNTSTDAELIVTLTLDDSSSAMAPSSVTILAGQDSASFLIQAIDDELADGNTVVTVQASADAHTSADDTLTISDDDVPALTVSVSASSINESDGNEAATGTVTRNTNIADAITVTLQSSNPNEAVVPQTVTIEAGQSTATFAIDAVDDLVVDGTQTVTILALADEHVTATSELDVTDNDSDIMPGDVDGNDRFDANDSFLIQLIKLAGSDQQIDQSKGSSPLTANQIRSKVDALSGSGDVDGDDDFDANDAFLVHLVKLAGTNAQIDQSKGNSPLTSLEIRSRIESLDDGGSQANFLPNGIQPMSLFRKNGDQPLVGPILPEADHAQTDFVLSQYRSWIDVL